MKIDICCQPYDVTRDIYNSYKYFYIHSEITHSLEECLFCKFGCQRVWEAYDDIYLRKTGSMLHPVKGYESWYWNVCKTDAAIRMPTYL